MKKKVLGEILPMEKRADNKENYESPSLKVLGIGVQKCLASSDSHFNEREGKCRSRNRDFAFRED